MNSKSVQIDLGNDQALARIQALTDAANELERSLARIASTLGTAGQGPNAQAEFSNTYRELQSTRGAISTAQQSISTGQTPSTGAFSIGAQGALASLGKSGYGSPSDFYSNMAAAGLTTAQAQAGFASSGYGPGTNAVMPVGAMSSQQILERAMQSVQFSQYAGLYQAGTTAQQWAGMQIPQGPAMQVGMPQAMGAAVQYGYHQYQGVLAAGGFGPAGINSTGMGLFNANAPGAATGGFGPAGPNSTGMGLFNAYSANQPAGGAIYSSPAGPGAYGSLGMGLFNQAQQAQQGRVNLIKSSAMQVGLYAAADVVDQYAQFQTSRTLEGGSGTMQAAQSYFGAGGAIIGGAIGTAILPGIGTAIGAGIGRGVGGSIGSWWASREVASENAGYAMAPFAGAYAGRWGMENYIQKYNAPSYIPGDVTKGGLVPQMGGWEGPSRFERINAYLNKQFDDNKMPELKGTVADIGQTFANLSSGLFAGGYDPERGMKGDSFVIPFIADKNTTAAEALQTAAGPPGSHSGMGRLLDTLIGTAAAAIGATTGRRSSYTSSTVAETYTERIGRLVGAKLAPGVSGRISPIFGTLPETGGNVTDILNRFGPEDTSTYLSIQNEYLVPKIDPMVLSRVSAGFRGTQREASIGALQARGSGMAAAGSIAAGILRLEELPDADKSELVAQQQAAFRGAVKTSFEQERTTQYSLPMTHLEGAIARSNVLPFNPSNRFGLELQVIGRNTAEVGHIRSFESQRRAAGQLSEDEELELESRIENLKTRTAQGVASLAVGMEDRLPGVSSGRPASFGRYDSINLAAMSLMGRGNPYRGYGALNSAQKQLQEDFTLSFGTGAQNPYSRIQGLDNIGGGQGADKIVSAINRVVQAILANPGSAGGSNRNQNYPPEARGQLSGQVKQGGFPGAFPNANSGAN